MAVSSLAEVFFLASWFLLLQADKRRPVFCSVLQYRRSSARVSWHWSDRIKTSQKEAFPLVEVELKRPDRNCSLFQALGQWGAAQRKRARKTVRRKRGRGGEEGTPSSLAPTPTPHPRFFFSAHISLRSPHNLNAWSRLPKLWPKKVLQFSSYFCA